MRKLLIIFWLSFTFGCKHDYTNDFYEAVNENFLNFTDTIAYRFGSFFPPPDNILANSKTRRTSLPVLIDTIFESSDALTNSIVAEIQKNQKLREFKYLIPNTKALSFTHINPARIINTGNYKLVDKTRLDIAGKITFIQPYVSAEKAIIPIQISASPKAGRTTVYL